MVWSSCPSCYYSILKRDSGIVIESTAHVKLKTEDTSKTAIKWKANLGFRQQEMYLAVALKLGYLRLDDRNYALTEKGQRFLNAYSLFSEENSKIQEALSVLKRERKNEL